MSWPRSLYPLALVLVTVGCKPSETPPQNTPTPSGEATNAGATQTPADKAQVGRAAHLQRARELAHRIVIVDGHIDVPYRLDKGRNADGAITENIAEATKDGQYDAPRAREGGLDAPFLSIYVPAEKQAEPGAAKAFADQLIDMMEGVVKAHPETFALVTSPEEIRANHDKGLLSFALGMENGAPIEGDLKNVAHFHRRGVRYITLTHSKDNQICDSSYDTSGTWKGLSPFGKQVVAEMNRLGILVDISHVSDRAFYQVLDLSEVPVIASHSSARHFTVDFERNMSDEMIAAMKENGGVIMVNFGSTFISDESRRYFDRQKNAMMAEAWKKKIDRDSPEMDAFLAEWVKEHPPVFATVDDVANHIDRIVRFAGVDHVGFGSDFDGVGDSLPIGLKDVSDYPTLIATLLSRGYTDEDIEKMASGNILRVWTAAQEHAAKAAGGTPTPGAIPRP